MNEKSNQENSWFADFGLFFIMDVIEQGFLVALLSWILALVVVFLLMLAIIFLFADE